MNLVGLCLISMTLVCCNQTTQVSDNSDRVKHPQIRFHYREIGANNGFYTYTDYLVIENYKNKSFIINDLVSFAIVYSDTVKADLPVTGIKFLGEPKGKKLPPGRTSEYHKHVDISVLSVGFNTATKEKLKEKKKIDVIALWKLGEATIYLNIDSILNSNLIIDNKDKY